MSYSKEVSITAALKTGETVQIDRIFFKAGKFEGEECDLVRYNKHGMKHIIERPLLAER